MSRGSQLTVIQCKDYLPEKYLPRAEETQPQLLEPEPEDEEERGPENDAGLDNAPGPIPKIGLDPSIHEALTEGGITAARS